MSTTEAQEKQEPASPARRGRFPHARLPVGLYRRSVSVFLATLVLFIVGMPLAQNVADPGLLEGMLLSVVLICGVMAVGARRKALLLAALLIVPALAAKWISHYRPDVPHAVFLVPGILLLILVSFELLRFTLRAPRVDAEVLAAGIATYVVLGVWWSLAYLLVVSFVPDAFVLAQDSAVKQSLDSFNALYFSFVTLTTLGYGDIVPAARVARMLAILEAITGALYLSVLVARLVTLYSDRQK
jgi:hypothetical protein